MSSRIPRVSRGQPLTAELWNQMADAVERGKVIVGPGAGLQAFQTVAGLSLQATPGDTPITYIQLTGPAAPDGGYPWVQVTQAPPIKITNTGTGYSSPPSASLSGGGWTGWNLTVTINATAGTVTSVYFSGSAGTAGTANVQPTISFSGGGGSGAAAQITDIQDVNTPVQWVTSSTTGGYSNAAYEARGCFGLPNDGVVYPAITGPNGKLLFFSNPVVVGKTSTAGSYPTAVSAFYAIQPVTLYGTQSEGSAVTFNTGPLTGGTYPVFYAYNIGTARPFQGTYVICRWTGTRWVFRFDVSPAGLQVTLHETPSTSLNVAVSQGYWVDSTTTTLTNFAAVSSFGLTASATNSIYLDNSGTLTKSTSGYPGSGHFTKLATAVTGGSTITSLTDDRQFTVAVNQS